MTRPALVMAKPLYPPSVCITCGVQSDRPWFVDIGLDLDILFDPRLNGNVYFCNLCWEALVADVTKLSQIFLNQTLPWAGSSYREPAYSDDSPLEGFIPGEDIVASPPPNTDNPDSPVGNPTEGFHFGTVDRATEDSDRTVAEHDQPVDGSDPDAELPEPASGVQEFQLHFGTGNAS